MTSHNCNVICKQTNRLDRLPEQFSLNRSSGGRCWLARPQGWWFSVSMRTHEPVSSSALQCLLVGHPLALWWYQEGRSVWNPTLQRKWKQCFIWIQTWMINNANIHIRDARAHHAGNILWVWLAREWFPCSFLPMHLSCSRFRVSLLLPNQTFFPQDARTQRNLKEE